MFYCKSSGPSGRRVRDSVIYPHASPAFTHRHTHTLIYFHYSIFRLVCLFCMRLDSENFIRLQRVHFIVFLHWPFSGLAKEKWDWEWVWECLWSIHYVHLFCTYCIFLSNIVYIWCKYLKLNLGKTFQLASQRYFIHTFARWASRQTLNPIEKRRSSSKSISVCRKRPFRMRVLKGKCQKKTPSNLVVR